MKKILNVVLVVGLSLVGLGCGDDKSSQQFTASPPPETIIMKYNSSSGELAMAQSASYISATDFKALGKKVKDLDYQVVDNVQGDEWNESLNSPQSGWHVFKRKAHSKQSKQRIRSTSCAAPFWFAAWLLGSVFAYSYYYSNYQDEYGSNYSGSYSSYDSDSVSYYLPSYYYEASWYPYNGYGSSYYHNWGSIWYYPYSYGY